MKPSWSENVNGQVIKHPAEIVDFDSQGKFDTDDKKVIAFLKKHKDFGRVFFVEEEEKENAPVE